MTEAIGYVVVCFDRAASGGEAIWNRLNRALHDDIPVDLLDVAYEVVSVHAGEAPGIFQVTLRPISPISALAGGSRPPDTTAATV